MLKAWWKRAAKSGAASKADNLHRAVSVAIEPLENRQLLHGGFGGFGGFGHGGDGPGIGGPGGGNQTTIAFSLAPTAVQTGLDKLATADGLTDPTSTQLVRLGNSNGVETYSVTIDGTGTVSTLTVDQLGDAVTAPTQTTTTWATLSGTGAGSDSAAAAEISAIATALSLTAPTSTDTVNVSTTSAGAVTYSIHLTGSATSTSDIDFGPTVAVDAAGNPVGNQQLPFSVFSSTIRTALNKNAPTGATALAATSTKNVDVRTTDGITTYSTTFTVTGTQTTVTVNSAGTLTSLPTTTTTTFSALSSALQKELQTLATADGVTTAIASTQSVSVLTETNGTVIYSVTLAATGTSASGSNFTFDVTVSVDSSGNPTTLPHDGGGFGNQGGDCGNGGVAPATNASGGSTSSSNSSSGTTISLPTSGVGTSGTTSVTTYPLTAKILASATSGFGMLGGYFVEFAPSTADAAVKADLATLQTAQKKLSTDTKGLTAAEKATLKADEKAIAAAIKAISATLAPLETTLKSDTAKWATTLRADQKAVRAAGKNTTTLAAAKAQLSDDEAAAFAAISKDQLAIQSAIDSATGVITAQAKLATDLPTIAADQSAIKADQTQLITDLDSQSSSTAT